MTPTSGDSDPFRTLDQDDETVVAKLGSLFERLFEIERHQDDQRTNPAFKEEFGEELKVDLARIQSRITQKLTDLLDFPPRFCGHFAGLSGLAKDRHTREKLVFIMTKFPEGESELDRQLKNVIEAARQCIKCITQIHINKPTHEIDSPSAPSPPATSTRTTS